jgi:hypothetical protein
LGEAGGGLGRRGPGLPAARLPVAATRAARGRKRAAQRGPRPARGSHAPVHCEVWFDTAARAASAHLRHHVGGGINGTGSCQCLPRRRHIRLGVRVAADSRGPRRSWLALSADLNTGNLNFESGFKLKFEDTVTSNGGSLSCRPKVRPGSESHGPGPGLPSRPPPTRSLTRSRWLGASGSFATRRAPTSGGGLPSAAAIARTVTVQRPRRMVLRSGMPVPGPWRPASGRGAVGRGAWDPEALRQGARAGPPARGGFLG